MHTALNAIPQYTAAANGDADCEYMSIGVLWLHPIPNLSYIHIPVIAPETHLSKIDLEVSVKNLGRTTG